ncbi:MAG TPA: MotB family protein [Roseiarcus sp.]|jgi:chemotaxis protein MotB|nr:MotB family protein [Roseiarcus sp.]
MTEAHPEIIIIKRHSAHEEEHHGGAWKIAFADFMTAMMAFFLVLWIISATDKNTKTLIARYFNPVKVEEPAKAQKGIHGAPEKGANYAPEDGNGAPDAGTPSSEHGEGPAEKGNENPASPSKQNQQARPPTPSPLPPPDPAKPYPTMSEQELFSDPRASLDKIAGAPPPGPRIDPSAALKGYGEVGPSADEALRDPFRPLGSDKAVNVVAEDPGAAPAASAPSDESASAPPIAAAAPASPGPAQAPAGSEAPGAGSPAPSTASPPAPDPVAARQTAASELLADLKRRLLGESKSMQGPQLDVQATEDGILISLTDRQNFSMFPIGSAEPQPRVLHMMEAIAASLQNLKGAIVVRGHTDARPYRSATYDNWRLSSARAQMAYYMLIRGGLSEKRFERVEGYADHHLRDSSHPLAAENRRIEILLREAKP